MHRIGVFDSGVGGKSVVQAIRLAIPDIEILYAEDKANIPYGNKSPDALFTLSLPILNTLSKTGCEVIVIACNTVTTNVIERLRASLPVPLVGMEPMVKPATEMSKSKVIAVCATPSTLSSPRYKWLKDTYAKNVQVLEPDCSDWAGMIETNKVDNQKIHERISEVCNNGADTIVLGCTHYHWIEKEVQAIASEYNATVLQPEQPVIAQLMTILKQLA